MAGRIFITGDTHGDFSRFGLDTFPMQTKLDKKDYVIILGDFGGVWNHNNSIAFQIEEQNLDALDNKSFSTLFIEGNHERYDRLYACPVETWHGGKVHRIRPNILHLMRGQIFNIAGRKFFAMGGAASHDYAVLLNQTESDYYDRKELLIADDIPFRTEGVKATGLFETIIFGYKEWFYEDNLVLTKAPDEKRKAIYRGWMMQPKKYKAFYNTLLEHNIELVTNPEEYERMHIFPNTYQTFGSDTAKIQLYPLHTQINVQELKHSFNRFMVKDYVKSVKGTDFPKYFEHSTTQEEFDKWMEVFYKYRGNLLTGGICIKEYFTLKRYGDHTNEYRVFYVNQKIATVAKNSGQPNYVPEVPEELIVRYSKLNSPYYTVDYAELEDGSWKVIEAGDGSVSGLSEYQDPERYFRAIFHCFN